MAPTPGDVGGCGQSPDLLDRAGLLREQEGDRLFALQRVRSLVGVLLRACDGGFPVATAFPKECYPLVHDGEVCLRALRHASCDDYSSYMDDASPTTASECNFCPPEKSP